MSITYTKNLDLSLIGSGTESGNWGNITNNALTEYLDIAISGGLTIPITSGNVTLVDTTGTASSPGIVSTGATGSSAQYAILNITGTKTAARTLNLPVTNLAGLAINGKRYYINNSGGSDVSGPYLLTVRGVTPTTGFTMVDGEKAVVAWNGSDYVKIASTGGAASFTTLSLSGSAATAPVDVTFSATAMAVNCALSNVFTTTFTANVTVAPTFSNLNDGQTINWFITQDATGSRTMTWPSSFKWAGGLIQTLSTGANAVDLLIATYRSATGYWYASLSKGFA
jgi:hypothetical protein